MVRVDIQRNETILTAIKRFKKQCEREGVLKDMRRNEYYEKPSEHRKRKAHKARKVIQDFMQEQREFMRSRLA